jgi:drug/metabolite transporter (DMT)-like permease
VAAFAGAAQGLGLAFYYQSLTVGAMGVVAPITASAALVPVIFGVAGGERPGALQAAGIVLTLAGIVMAARSAGDDGDEAPSNGGRLALGVGFALFAAVGIGLFLAGLGEASNHGSVIWAVLISRVSSVALLVAVAGAAGGWVRVHRPDFPALALVGVLSIVATLLFAKATTLGLVSVVAVIGALYPVTTVLLASTVLRERLGWVQRAGTVLALVGVAAIVAG